MTQDIDVERILSRYRPSSPPAALRDRAVSGGRGARPRVSIYLKVSAAAAAIFAASVLHMQASRSFANMSRPTVERATQTRAAAIDEMADLLGGGELGRRAAEQWMAASEAAARATQASGMEIAWIR